MTYARAVCALVFGCLLCSGRLPAAATPRAYASALTSAASTLDRAARVGKVPSRSAVPEISPALNTWLSAGLTAARKEKNSSARKDDLRAMAASLRAGAELSLRTRGAAPKNLATDVRRVLAEPAFRVPAGSNPSTEKKSSWLEQLLQRFFDWWAKVTARAITAVAAAPAIGNVAAFVLISAAALALAFLIVRVTTVLIVRRARLGESNELGTPLADRGDADTAYEAARAAARAGSFGLAIALLFQAALFALDRSGQVPYDSARTAGEYRRAVRRSAGSAAGPFDTLARAFTNVAYAQSNADESDWRSADAAYASMSFSAAERL